MNLKDDIIPVWFCDGKLRFIPTENFMQKCICGTKAFYESTGGCPEHGIYTVIKIEDSRAA